MPAAGSADPGRRSRLGTRTAAGLARDRNLHTAFGLLAVKGVFQRDLEVIAQIGATLRPVLPATAHEFAEDIVEYV